MGSVGRGRPCKVDDNHGRICAVWRALGAAVIDFSAVGKGCPDVAVLYRGCTHWAEIKDGEKSPSRRRLTPDQVRWHGVAHARGVTVQVIETEQQARAMLGVDV